jgi:predicted nucleotidyltransferase component of viral defense system
MLRTETVADDTLELLKQLQQKDYLQDFILVGGTALSLQIGHRISVDLDMFTSVDFDPKELKMTLEEDFSNFRVELERPNTLITTINDVKVDFIRFKYGFAYPIIEFEKVRLANIKDIASMKLDAISGRGKKKDFFDLYFLFQHFTLKELLDLYKVKYPNVSVFHVIKSMNYFEEAESDLNPIILDKNITWAKVKKRVELEIKKL